MRYERLPARRGEAPDALPANDLAALIAAMFGGQVPPGLPLTAERGGADEMPSLGGRMLYVEDNVRIAEITEMMLEELGFEVTWAECGEDAIRIMDEATVPFDLVFTDVVMPGISGVGLAKRLARQFPDLPIILTSGFSGELVAGFGSEFELLQKPFTRRDLIACLQRHMDPRRHH